MAKAKRKNSKKKFVIIGAGVVLIAVIIALVAFSGNKENIISVQTEKVQERTITQVVSATGKINPVEKVVITPEVSGEIVELPVEEGDIVKKGQLLIRIKPETYIAQRNRAKASLVSAKATLKIREATLTQLKAEYERIKGLYEKNLVSDSQLETAKANFLTSEGSLEAQKASVLQANETVKEAEEELAKTAIYSPLNGTVTALNVELGERILGSGFSQGTNLMTVSDLSVMEAIVEVDENDVVLVSVGDTSRIEIDAFGERKFLGKVSHIGNSAQTTGLGTQDEVVNFEVKIRLLELDGEIRPGMSCDADVETDTRVNVMAVPIQSVTARLPKDDNNDNMNGEVEGNKEQDENAEMNENGNHESKKTIEVVFVVEDGKAVMKPVKIGISDDTYIEITEGVDADIDVISGPYRAISKELQDGVKVSMQSGNKFGFKKKGSN